MGNSPSRRYVSDGVFPFFFEKESCTKEKSSAYDDFTLCECGEIQPSQRSRHCWGTWFLEQTTKDRFRPQSVSILDSDHESSCSVDTPETSLVLSFDLDEDDAILRLKQQGCELEQQDKLDEAAVVYHNLLELLRATGGSERLGEIHWRSGVVQWKRGVYAESLRHLDQAMFAYQLHCHGCSQTNLKVDVCEVLLATARVHLSLDNRSLATKCCRRAIQLLKEISDDELREHVQPLFGKIVHGIATVYDAGWALDNAAHCQVALNLRRQPHSDAAQADAASTLLTLGSLHEEKGNYEMALEYFAEAYDAYRELVANPSTATDIGTCLTHIGLLHFINGNQQDAMEAYLEALSLFRPMNDDRNVATVLTRLGMVHLAQGYDDEAITAYEEALELQRRVLGIDHDDVATTLMALLSIMERRQEWKKAIEYLDGVLRIHGATSALLLQLGELHTKDGNCDAASHCFALANEFYSAGQLEMAFL
jgi:tetratricopeptide (TPR) repeat protein